MKGSRVATRYAKSLVNLALQQGELEKTYADMQLVLETCKNADLLAFLKSPIIKTDKKLSVLRAIFQSNVSKLTQSFIDIITRKKRETYLAEIAQEFIVHYRVHKKILTAVITSAWGLDQELKKKVMDIVKESVKSEVELVEKINSDLIGGFILRIGDRQVDASIARKLKQLTMSFSENPYIKEY